jgi:hypothetical protein
MWTIAAPAFSAAKAEFAISSGVTGTAGFFPGVGADPVTAHVMIVLSDIDLFSFKFNITLSAFSFKENTYKYFKFS